MSDIDTQIESLLDNWLDNTMNTSYISVGIDGYKGEIDPDKIEELRTADFEKYRSDTVKAIKTLLIQQQGGLDKPSDTASVGGNQADNRCVDCGKDLSRCENCERLWQT